MSSPTSSAAITTDRAPAAAHSFSQGVRRGPFVQVSGQGPVDPQTQEHIGAGDVRAQTSRVLENVRAVLEAGGASVADVLTFRVYLRHEEDFAAMNEVYAEFLAEHVPSGVLPARTTVFVGLPHPQMLVEIDALAVTEG